jgi:hypothetical protein
MTEKKTTFVRIANIDHERRMVYGVVYEPYVLDTYGEIMLPEDIEKMAHRFMQLPELHRTIDVNHDNEAIKAHPIESWIVRETGGDYPVGSWVLGVKIDDPFIWEKIKSGELNGFSFEALVKAVEVDIEYDIVRDHVGQTEENDDHTHLFFVQLDDIGRVARGWTSVVNGHSHKIRHGTATEKTDGHGHRLFL